MDEEELHWKKFRETGSIASRNWLCEKYRYLVTQSRLKIISTQRDPEDVEQEGVLTLLKAIQTYNPDQGTKFTTYAITCIRRRYMNLGRNTSRRDKRHCDLSV